jgi:hypothetical protein
MGFLFCLFQGKSFFLFLEKKNRGNWLMAAKLLLPFSFYISYYLWLMDILPRVCRGRPGVAFDFQREIATFSGRVAMIPARLVSAAVLWRRLLLLRRFWLWLASIVVVVVIITITS